MMADNADHQVREVLRKDGWRVQAFHNCPEQVNRDAE